MSNSTRERDLVLAPNEYAYISDQTKGHIVAYVGPFKTSMANTDQPVFFNEKEKGFKACNLDVSIKKFTTVPEGWYVMLKNPPETGEQPAKGTANSLAKLSVGRKVNIPGPAFFALWPGQMVRVIQGHRLRSNQYLIVRVYEEEQAKKNWTNAVIMPQKHSTEVKEDNNDNDIKEVVPDSKIPNLAVGKLLVIKGTSVSFYIPPTGVEVVPDKNNNYVRNAVTLERLEYCILLDENGNKRYIRGPEVVIPKPTERFYVKNGQRKFKAIELSETSGIYVKVIAPYSENEKKYKVGDELFITGQEQMIYFPRVEHALIKYGEQEIYNAVAIPPGEGRYYLNRKTGQISLQKGPCMFLPDPREAVIVQRILSKKQAELWYPGNKEVIDYNEQLKSVAKNDNLDEYIMPQQLEQYFQQEVIVEEAKEASLEIASDEFIRSQGMTAPRTITLDTKYEGAVTFDAWTGYAVMITSKTGTRKVIVGPKTHLLEYDENLAANELSTGTPKSDDKTIKTVYLRVLHNKVSDIVEIETKDLCPAEISLSYRVNFTGDPEKWFNVENYVKFLTDHMRSVIRNAAKKYSIVDFYANGIDILRNIILGKANENGTREGGLFKENGMQIYDVEVFNISILDEEIEELLFDAQHEEMKQKVRITSQKYTYEFTKENEDLERKIASEKSATTIQNIDLNMQEAEKNLLFNLSKIEADIQTQQKALAARLEEQELQNQINEHELSREKSAKEMHLELANKTLEQDIVRLKASVEAVVNKAEAVSPDLIAALQAFSDKALAEKMAESMAPLAILGGKSVAEVFSNLLKGTSLENVIKKAIPNNLVE